MTSERRADEGAFELELGYASVRGRVVGEAPRTLVAVPDPPNLVDHHHDVFERLRDSYRIISFELPGFGRSRLRKGMRFGIDSQVELMGEVLERLSARRVVLEMSCLGALVGLRLARRRPELIDKLVLAQVSTLAQMQAWAKGADVWNIIHTPALGQAFVFLARKLIARHWFRAALPEGTDEQTYQRYLQPTLAALEQGGPFELASAYQAVRRATEVDYGQITQATLLLFGDADRTHRLTGTDPRALRQALPRAELVQGESWGHFPTLEDPVRYATTLKDWDAASPSLST
jgi:pimeloyl-ACP methyl ester carboxylesterase